MFILQILMQPRPQQLPPLFQFPPLFGAIGDLPGLRPRRVVPPVLEEPALPVFRAPLPQRSRSFGEWLQDTFTPDPNPDFFLIPGMIPNPNRRFSPGYIGPQA